MESPHPQNEQHLTKANLTMDMFDMNQIRQLQAFSALAPAQTEERAFNLREILGKILSRWWLIFSIVLLATSLTAVNVYRQKSIYQATATIVFGKQNILKLSGDLGLIQDPQTDLQTSMFLLQSRPLLEDVVSRLRLDKDPAFNDSTPTRSLWDAVYAKQEPSPTPTPGADASAEEIDLPAKISPRTEDDTTIDPELSPYVAMLRGGLTITPMSGTRLIQISFQHYDPELATRIVNGVADSFIDRSFKAEVAQFSNTSQWLDATTRKFESQVREAEQSLADYTRSRGIFSTEGKEDLTATKLVKLHGEYMTAESKRILTESIYQQVVKGKVAELPEAYANSNTGELQKKLNELTVEVAQMSVRFGARNPRVIEAQQQIAALQQQIEFSKKTLEEKLKADYERAVQDAQALKIAFDRAKAEAVEQNQTTIQFGILKQNVDTAKQLYTDFLMKTNQADAQLAEQHRNVSLAEPAEKPGTPVGPNRFRAIMLAFLLSLVGGVGLVFLIDYLDNKVKTVDDLHRYTNLPTFGVIPSIGTAGGESEGLTLARFEGDKEIESSYSGSEAYRRLRTSILLANPGTPPKKILFTSSVAGEGKTTTCINVGITLANLGARVLIIDADMRKPRLHKIFNLDNKKGLSFYLSNNIEMDEAIKESEQANLWLMTAGIIPPNSSDLVSSEKMVNLLNQAVEKFDHILIDSPPVLGASDPVILSRMVDGVILVVQGDRATREMLRNATQELKKVGAKIFGTVLNKVKAKQDRYDSYYYYYHYYHHGDGGEDMAQEPIDDRPSENESEQKGDQATQA